MKSTENTRKPGWLNRQLELACKRAELQNHIRSLSDSEVVAVINYIVNELRKPERCIETFKHGHTLYHCDLERYHEGSHHMS